MSRQKREATIRIGQDGESFVIGAIRADGSKGGYARAQSWESAAAMAAAISRDAVLDLEQRRRAERGAK